MKKLWAVLTVISLLLSLAACGKNEVRALEEGLEAQRSVSAGLDWDGAYAAHRPEDIVFTVGTEAVTWQEFFYQIAYGTAALESSSGAVITDWGLEMTGENGEVISVGDYVLETAVNLIKEYHVIREQLLARGLSLSEEGQARVDAYRETTIKESFAGDEMAFRSWLESLYGSEELWQWICQTDELYNEGLELLFGPQGEDLTPEEVLSYGEENGYVAIKQIYIYNNSASSAGSEESGEVDVMGLMLAELAQWKEDPEGLERCFDELREQYNENLSLDFYPKGRCVGPWDVESAVYEAACSMEDYEYAIVSLTEADVLLLRLPLGPEMDVLYDGENDQMYSLRLFAAWQAYTDLIHGPGGWMETATLRWESPFEDFSLAKVFQ